MRDGFRPPCLVYVLAALLGLVLTASQAGAQARSTLVADVGGRTIEIHLYRPATTGRAPLLILSHGSPGDPEQRGRMGPDTLGRQAEALVREGFAVAVPIRRGYGGQGEWAEGFGRCADPDYAAAALATAQDIRAAITAATQEPGIDASRVVLIGHSAGGWGSLAAASQGGVLGVVSFAGGRGSRGPDQVCAEEKLVAAAARFGRETRVPELWIYSRNDRLFGPDLAGRLRDAFVGAGGRAELVIAEPYRQDGHRYVDAISSWLPEVRDFLHRIGALR